MNRTAIIRRLHDMVDSLLETPEDWWEHGVYPMVKIGLRATEDDTEIVTLVVGLEVYERT